MGTKLADNAEVLFRQIHPDLMQQGEPSSSNFRPKESDNDKLSVDRGALISAEAAFDQYIGNGLDSVAVYGISVGEFGEVGIDCEHDPIEATEGAAANSAHAVASFVGFGTNRRKTLAKRLKKAAIARGLLHSPPIG